MSDTVGIVITLLLTILGIFFVFLGNNKLNKVKEYEFNNVSNGGVLQFDSFDESKKHERRKSVAKALIVIGTWLILIFGLLSYLVYTNGKF